jgi:5'-3' exonuclease
MSIQQRPVLIVDAMNAFVRSWAAYPTMSSHGYQMGGSIGFLKTLRRLVLEQQPSAVYVCWEGGGSSRRRKLYPEYKLNRRPEKLNRFYADDIPDTDENRKHQIIALLGMLKCVPICQIYVSDCEGDDVVAYLSRGPMRAVHKVIASSDKDLYQLLDDKTKIYSLHKKTYVMEPDVLDEFRVTAKNFAIAKALCGDPGDNVPGIQGLGFKTVAKRFPFLGLEQEILLQDVHDYAHSHLDESTMYKRIVDSWSDVKRNWDLVYLDGSMLSATQASQVDHLISSFKPTVDKMGLIKQLIKEGIGDFDVENFYYAFNCIENIEYKTGDKR